MEEEKYTIGSGTARLAGLRWTVTRKREVSLWLLRGESMEALARELGVEIYRLEEWKNKAPGRH